jgi:hypothetical protein
MLCSINSRDPVHHHLPGDSHLSLKLEVPGPLRHLAASGPEGPTGTASVGPPWQCSWPLHSRKNMRPVKPPCCTAIYFANRKVPKRKQQLGGYKLLLGNGLFGICCDAMPHPHRPRPLTPVSPQSDSPNPSTPGERQELGHNVIAADHARCSPGWPCPQSLFH